jgi:hypothetical protein
VGAHDFKVFFISGTDYSTNFSRGQCDEYVMGQAHTLPPRAGVDGLLGLDFFRGHSLEASGNSHVSGIPETWK